MTDYILPKGWTRGELLAYYREGSDYVFHRAQPMKTNDDHQVFDGNSDTLRMPDSIAAQNFMGWWYDKAHR